MLKTIIFFITIIILCSSSALTQTTRLTNQADVDTFDTSITILPGTLILGDDSIGGISDIYDLSNLSNLHQINGSLEIHGTQIVDVDPLARIDSIGYNLVLDGNRLLENIDGFSGLRKVEGSIELIWSIALTSLTGFSGLTGIGTLGVWSDEGNLWIEKCNALETLSGLENLTYIAGALKLAANANLNSIAALRNLEEVGQELILFNLPKVETLLPLINLETFTDIQIFSSGLTNLEGLNNLKSCSSLEIEFNAYLENIDALANLKNVYDHLEIYTNPLLSDCCGIQELLNDPDLQADIVGINGNATGCDSEQAVLENTCFCFGCPYFIQGQVGFNESCDEILIPCNSCKLDVVNVQDPTKKTYTFTDENGNYYFKADSGSYTVNVPVLQNETAYELLCPSSTETNVKLDSLIPVADSIDYIYKIPNGKDATVNLIALSNPRPERNFEIKIQVSNLLGKLDDALLVLAFDPSIADSLVSSNLPVVSMDFSTGEIIYDLSDLEALASAEYNLVFNTNEDAMIDEAFCITASVSASGDSNAANDKATLCSTVVNSYDPNLIEVHQLSNGNEFQGGNILTTAGTRELDKLYYTVRFQNTGTAPAIDIEVRDTLDDNALRLPSLLMIESSHDYEIALIENILICKFNNIYLPDSTTNIEESNGHFTYSIELLADVSEPVSNRAAIYFDNNEPVITNSVVLNPIFDNDGDGYIEAEDCDDENANVNPSMTEVTNNGIDDDCDGEIDETSSARTTDQQVFSLYPTPTNGILFLDTSEKISEVLLYDLNGQKLKTKNNPGNQWDLSELQGGVYLLEIIIGNSNHFTKVFKI